MMNLSESAGSRIDSNIVASREEWEGGKKYASLRTGWEAVGEAGQPAEFVILKKTTKDRKTASCSIGVLNPCGKAMAIIQVTSKKIKRAADVQLEIRVELIGYERTA